MLVAAAAGIASLLPAYNWAVAQQPPNALSSVRDDLVQQGHCRRDREVAAQAHAKGINLRTQELIKRLETAIPFADAMVGIERGDFRLVRGKGMLGNAPMGVDCRISRANRWEGQPLTLAERAYSDVVPDCEGRDRRRCLIDRLFGAYGQAYNRAVVSDPRYPFSDLCRPSASEPTPWKNYDDPVEYGFPNLAITERPHDLHEAARRGSLESVASLIKVDGGAIDRPDPYALTPLAWAVIRRRPDVADMLLHAGADPLGADCDDPGRMGSPLRLALQSGQEDLALRLLSFADKPRLLPWPEGLVKAAARGGAASLLRRMLAEPRLGQAAENLLSQRGEPYPPQSEKVFKDYLESLCWRGGVRGGTKIRMVGAYESKLAPSGTGHQRGPITVRLPPSAVPVLLAVSAYEPVEWQIEAPRSARLAGVIATGMYRPVVTGDIRGVEVLINDQRDHCAALRGSKLYADEPDQDQQRLAQTLSLMFGAPVADFTGTYSGSIFNLE